MTYLLYLSLLAAQADPAGQMDLAAMQGRWILMSWQDDGYDVVGTNKGPAEITIDGPRFRYQVFDGGRHHDDNLLSLDPSKDPKRLTLLNEKQVHPLFKDTEGKPLPYQGAYRISGDELRITLNLKSGKAISLALDNSRARPGVKPRSLVDGLEEESDKLYVLMREDGYTAGTAGIATGLKLGTAKRPLWTAVPEGGQLTAPMNWQRLRFWYEATESDAVTVDLGGGAILHLGAVLPSKLPSATQKNDQLFRYPTARIGDQVAHGSDVPYRAKFGEGPEKKGAEPFWFSVDLRRQDGELRVWITGQTVLTTKTGAASSPVKVGVKSGGMLREVRWLDAAASGKK
jgi:uncharacterized protein (TIGR03067 family)